MLDYKHTHCGYAQRARSFHFTLRKRCVKYALSTFIVSLKIQNWSWFTQLLIIRKDSLCFWYFCLNVVNFLSLFSFALCIYICNTIDCNAFNLGYCNSFPRISQSVQSKWISLPGVIDYPFSRIAILTLGYDNTLSCVIQGNDIQSEKNGLSKSREWNTNPWERITIVESRLYNSIKRFTFGYLKNLHVPSGLS